MHSIHGSRSRKKMSRPNFSQFRSLKICLSKILVQFANFDLRILKHWKMFGQGDSAVLAARPNISPFFESPFMSKFVWWRNLDRLFLGQWDSLKFGRYQYIYMTGRPSVVAVLYSSIGGERGFKPRGFWILTLPDKPFPNCRFSQIRGSTECFVVQERRALWKGLSGCSS